MNSLRSLKKALIVSSIMLFVFDIGCQEAGQASADRQDREDKAVVVADVAATAPSDPSAHAKRTRSGKSLQPINQVEIDAKNTELRRRLADRPATAEKATSTSATRAGELDSNAGPPTRSVIGLDDRRQVAARYPYHCIGKIITDDFVCSGALIGRRLILTAFHCVPFESKYSLDSIGPALFVPYYDEGNAPYGYANVVRWIHDAEIDLPGYENRRGGRRLDWAIGVLDEPLGDRLGYFGSKPFNDSWFGMNTFQVAGYSGDFWNGSRLGVDFAATIRMWDNPDYVGNKVLLHDGDTMGGASGGPIFAWWDDSVRILAIISAHRGGEYISEWSPGTTNLAVEEQNWGWAVEDARAKYP